MRVIHLSHQESDGGAAVAASRLRSGLADLGVDASMLVARRLGAPGAVSAIPTPFRAKLLKKMDGLPRRLLRTTNQTLMSPAWVGSPVWRAVNRAGPDLAHLHWINDGFLSIEALPRFAVPLVWSLHDMWTFAGAEHYVDGCTRYKDGYRSDNRPAGEAGFDLNRWVWARKMRAWRRVRRLTLFTVSRWMAERARESILFHDRPIQVLYNGIDPELFQPSSQAQARRELELPPDGPLVLYGALDATSDRRKGFDLVHAALGQLRHRRSDLALVVFGNSPESARQAPEFAGFKTYYLGRIHDPARLARIYAACDVTVVPSRQEAFGQTALEALACGVPVAAFRVGGLPEIVAHRGSGYLAEPFDTAELAAGILWLLEQRGTDAGRRIAAAGRQKVLENFTLRIQAERCRELYGQILAERP